jgi:hypothetical protein
LNDLISLKSEKIENAGIENGNETAPRKYSFFFNSKRAIIDFKIIIKETGIGYRIF